MIPVQTIHTLKRHTHTQLLTFYGLARQGWEGEVHDVDADDSWLEQAWSRLDCEDNTWDVICETQMNRIHTQKRSLFHRVQCQCATLKTSSSCTSVRIFSSLRLVYSFRIVCEDLRRVCGPYGQKKTKRHFKCSLWVLWIWRCVDGPRQTCDLLENGCAWGWSAACSRRM